MIVVADTSVILNLCQVGLHPLLKDLFEEVLAPLEVAEEFARIVKEYPLFGGVSFPEWIQVEATEQTLRMRAPWVQLDSGESAAIELALEKKADAVLLDELANAKPILALGQSTRKDSYFS